MTNVTFQKLLRDNQLVIRGALEHIPHCTVVHLDIFGTGGRQDDLRAYRVSVILKLARAPYCPEVNVDDYQWSEAPFDSWLCMWNNPSCNSEDAVHVMRIVREGDREPMAVSGWRWNQIYGWILGELTRLPTVLRAPGGLMPNERKANNRLCAEIGVIRGRFYSFIENLNDQAERFGFETK